MSVQTLTLSVVCILYWNVYLYVSFTLPLFCYVIYVGSRNKMVHLKGFFQINEFELKWSSCVFLFFLQPRHAVKLLSVLKYMAHRTGPDSFFSFPGKNAAVSIPHNVQHCTTGWKNTPPQWCTQIDDKLMKVLLLALHILFPLVFIPFFKNSQLFYFCLNAVECLESIYLVFAEMRSISTNNRLSYWVSDWINLALVNADLSWDLLNRAVNILTVPFMYSSFFLHLLPH